ncbi:glycosyltransferase family 2 protein [Streptomyces sp. NRRL F-5135]|uniref:glycosyltransferase family 2 protein n=1 Tax=Streptomyces sp. NRRL F-5135 TaxID=1463858 RepID=UPI0006906CC4|nr:glycosyltransferase [Streptomyces sp. NRRL F-5135]
MDTPPRVTAVITSRERFSYAEESLKSFYEHTRVPCHVVYVDVNSPRDRWERLRRLSDERGFTAVRVNKYVSPNCARNIGLRYAVGEYVVFLDNDVEYTPNWLEPLLSCADEEKAALVGPLYLHGPLQEQTVHMAGGDMEFSGTWGTRSFVQTQRHFMKHLSEVPAEELRRQRCDIIEFHCALVRRSVFDQVGGMDEGLLTTREHLDFSRRVLDAGGTVWFEPASVITYRMPPPFALTDLPYFMLRWSDAWTAETLKHFANKYGIEPSYVERVAKNRKGRQWLLFEQIKRYLPDTLGERGTTAVKRAFQKVEPIGNRVLVELLALREPPLEWRCHHGSGSPAREPSAAGPVSAAS